jgi:hypothetical protein
MRIRLASLLVVWAAASAAACGGSAPAPMSTTPASRSVLADTSVEAEGAREEVVVASAGESTGATGGAPAAPASAAPAPPPAGPVQAATPVLKEQLVIEAWLSIEVEDAAATARALRELVEKSEGRVVSEQLSGAAQSWSASIQLRLPPRSVNSVIDWLGRQGDVTSKRIQGTDVSKTLFDQQIALDNLTLTLERLRKLLDAGGLQMKDILEIEREMTRLRGEIERIKGEKRFLEDRVALATVNVELTRRAGAVMSPKAKIYPGPRLALLTLFDAGGRKVNRLGGGVAMHLGIPRISLELDVFDDAPAEGDHPRESHAVLATWGGAMYSDFLGRGEREFFNPYIGFRAGYGYLDYHAFVLQGEVGLELYKQTHMMIDASVRATGLIGEDDVDAGLVTGASAVFAF